MPNDSAFDASASSNDLYVGYLAVPRRQRRFLWMLVPAGLWALLAASALIAWSQPGAGSGVWDNATARAFTGVIVGNPYPMLYADDRGDGTPGFLLLVEMGKHGAHRAAAFDGQRVRLSGWLLHREGRVMLELEPGDRGIAVTVAGTELRSPPAPMDLGPVSLPGEIVDSKCFLGAMKPGHGKTHKECATLCIAGGIPPMLVSHDTRGNRTFYLLANESGGPLDRAALPYIADPVEVTGQLERRGDLLVLRLHATAIHRL